jgi:hypothetical protein
VNAFTALNAPVGQDWVGRRDAPQTSVEGRSEECLFSQARTRIAGDLYGGIPEDEVGRRNERDLGDQQLFMTAARVNLYLPH